MNYKEKKKKKKKRNLEKMIARTAFKQHHLRTPLTRSVTTSATPHTKWPTTPTGRNAPPKKTNQLNMTSSMQRTRLPPQKMVNRTHSTLNTPPNTFKQVHTYTTKPQTPQKKQNQQTGHSTTGQHPIEDLKTKKKGKIE